MSIPQLLNTACSALGISTYKRFHIRKHAYDVAFEHSHILDPAEITLIKINQGKCAVNRSGAELTLQICASHKLENLVNEDDGEGELQHHHPLLYVQVCQLEDHLWMRAVPC